MNNDTLTSKLKKRRKLNRDMQIYRRYCEGYQTKEICKIFGLNKSQVCKILRELEQGGLAFKRLEKTPLD